LLGVARRALRRHVVGSTHRVVDRRLAAAGLIGYVGVGLLAGRREDAWESRAATLLNREPGRRPLLRAPQQLGTPWVLPGVAAVAFWRHRPHLAAAAALALPLEKALEVGTKTAMRRRRPAESPLPVELRDDAPADGPAYPSGHVAIAFAATTLLVPYVDPPVSALAAAGGLLVGVRRVHQGAHFPLDSLGGALLGIGVGSTSTFVIGRPAGIDGRVLGSVNRW
jgi:membrane-associated phospholipid phosphatase